MKLKNKIIYITILLFLVINIGKAQDLKNYELKKYNILSNVKSVKKITYKVKGKNENIESDIKNNNQFLINEELIVFNEKSHLIEEKTAFIKNDYADLVSKLNNSEETNRTFHFKIDYQYDTSGNIIEINKFNVDGSIYNILTFKYDEKNKIIEECSYEPIGGLFGSTFRYIDEKGERIDLLPRKPDCFMLYKKIFKYDEKNNLIEEIKINGIGKLKDQIKYEYDELNRLKETSFFNLKTKRFSDYDKKGQLTRERLETLEGKPVSKNLYKYDDNENKIKNDFYGSDGSLRYSNSYKFDVKKNVVLGSGYSTITKNIPGNTIIDYVYDEKGNWIKKTMFFKDISTEIQIREIEYFAN
jgi:hypothetical protein